MDFKWTYVDTRTKRFVHFLMQCELALSDFHFDDVLVTYNRLGLMPSEWSTAFKNRLETKAYWQMDPSERGRPPPRYLFISCSFFLFILLLQRCRS